MINIFYDSLTAFPRAVQEHEQEVLPATSKATTLAEKIFSGNLPRELPANFLRDTTWTSVSALNINLAGRAMPPLDPTAPLSSQITSSSFALPMGAQWFFGTIPMLLLAGGEIAYRKSKGQEVPYSKIMAPVAAASLAIPMWDLGQVIGTHIGTTSSCFQGSSLWYGSSIAAGMIAAPFTGMFEGFTQWGVKYIFDLATEPDFREKWSQKPYLMAKLLLKELSLNITIGAIPGAVWQIVYFFVLPVLLAASGPVGWGILCAGLLVGLAVMLCNFACTHAINKASANIDRAMGWDKELEELEQKIQEEKAHEIQKQEQLASASQALLSSEFVA